MSRINRGLTNDKKTFLTNIIIDNVPPSASWKELSTSDGKSKVEISCNEGIRPISGWNLSDNQQLLSKEFLNCVCYPLPIMDFAENSSEVLVTIQNATHLALYYGTYDEYTNKTTIVSGGKISDPNTVSSNTICKTEAIYIRTVGLSLHNCLQAKAYLHTYWGEGARSFCLYSELPYYHGYNPTNRSSWWNVNYENGLNYLKNYYTQLGGIGVNKPNKTSSIYKPLPPDIAKQYLYGISSIQFQLKNSSEFSVVYQSYVKDIGWLPVSSDGEENLYQHNKPISALRINFVPKTEKQYLIDFWNRDVGTNHLD